MRTIKTKRIFKIKNKKNKKRSKSKKLIHVKTVEEIYNVTKKSKPILNNSLHNTLKNFHAKKIRCSPKKKEELNMFFRVN